MPIAPYPLNAGTFDEYKQSSWHLFRDLYEERLAGCILGDVFTIEGNNLLTFNYASTGCLETSSDGCSVTTYPDMGFSLNEAGLGLDVKQLGLNTSGGYVLLQAGGAPGSYWTHIGKGVPSASYATWIAFYCYIDAENWYIDVDNLPGGEYGFYPQIKFGTSGGLYYCWAWQEYITSSGEVDWIFLKRNKSSGEITGGYFAPDHPCFGNGNDPLLIPHPFGIVKDDEEVIVINPTKEQVRKLKHLARPDEIGQARKSPLDFIGEGRHFDIGKEEREYPKIPVTIGIVEEDQRPLWFSDTAKIMRCRIPQPEKVKVRHLDASRYN